MHAHTNARSHPNVFLYVYGNKKNKRRTRLVIAKHVMNITIFYKEEDEERNTLIVNCEEGMEETYVVATASLLVFFL
jgi:hypothetical protein